MRAATARQIRSELHTVTEALMSVQEIQTGRDTHPLFDERITDPASFYVASKVEEIRASVEGLKDMLDSVELLSGLDEGTS